MRKLGKMQIVINDDLRFDRLHSRVHLESVDHSIIELVSKSLCSTERTNKSLKKALVAHLQNPGRRIRAKLALDACSALGVNSGDALSLAMVCEMLHSASLIHDDIQDCDTERRGQPTLWVTYGIDLAICAGDALLSGAFGALAEFSKPDRLPLMLQRVCQRTADALGGQSADLATRTQPVQDIAHYEAIAAQKSGALLGLPLELALLAAGWAMHCETARVAAASFAIGYQILDDIADRTNDLATPDKAAALNVVEVLVAAGYGARAIDEARSSGRAHLDRAIREAGRLPGDVGATLIEMARALSVQLQ